MFRKKKFIIKFKEVYNKYLMECRLSPNVIGPFLSRLIDQVDVYEDIAKEIFGLSKEKIEDLEHTWRHE